MNPNTNEFEKLDPTKVEKTLKEHLLSHEKNLLDRIQKIDPAQPFQPEYKVGERVEIKGYFFEVTDIGKDRLVLKPVGSYIVGEDDKT